MARSAGAGTRRRGSGGNRSGARSPCPVAGALDLVGDRWTLLVLRDLLIGKSRYGQFLASPEGISTNLLADRLQRLEAAGLVTAVPYSEHPVRMDYRLTPAGRALGPVVDALAAWGLAHLPGTRQQLGAEPTTG
ncbi:MAG TPA: helix-turn-helix domain-containing protein [Pseudonocardiaceae bacterium]|nr:helix-turn-helix domain-containing protein [Pseudonocardiaceae bacterium]